MNKRHEKKRNKIIKDRYDFFKRHVFEEGRRISKSNSVSVIDKAIKSKQYKLFKLLKKGINKSFYAIDYSSSKDFSAMVRMQTMNNGGIKILNIEMFYGRN